MTKLYFFFPYDEECGVPMLWLRMSRWVAEHYGNEFDCYVVDYPDGAMARNITEADKVKVYPYSDERVCVFEDNAIVVFQSNNISFIFQNLKLSPKTKIFWWTLHVRCLAPVLIPMPLGEITFRYNWLYKTASMFYLDFMHRFAKLVDDMIARDALVFMDTPTFEGGVTHLPMKTKTMDRFLPVPAPDYDGILKCERTQGGLNVCWLGRLSDEKTPILKYTIRKLSEYALKHQQKITMHVLGWGEYQDEVDNLGLENKYYSQIKTKPIKSTEVNSFLLQNIDLMFAMGTSALEAAKLGVPTVMVDISYKEIDGDYIFKPIYERTGYELAHQITKADFEIGNTSLERIMDLVNNHFQDFSQKSRDYFVRNHALSTVGEQFVGLLRKLDYTYDMIDPKVIDPLWTWKIYHSFRRIINRK